ncbi:MAG: tetratricopeptide repeat protein [Chloroflexota bacterium]
MTTALIQDAEPTPEFYSRSITIMNRWQSGELPFDDAAQSLALMNQEAVLDNHLANQGRIEQIMGVMQSYRGNLNVSIHHYERARAFFIQVNNALRIAICDLNLGEVYRYKGDFNRARVLYEKAYESSKVLGNLENQAFAIGNKGQMLLSIGQLDAARRDLLESYRLSGEFAPDSDERTSLQCELHHALTLLYLLQADSDAAWNEAKQAYEIACQVPQPLEKGFANRAVAEVVTALNGIPDDGFSGDPDIYYQAANEAFYEINAEGEIARTMFAHAKSLAQRGRRMTAARKLQHAMIIFTRLGMIDDAAKAAEVQLEVL